VAHLQAGRSLSASQGATTTSPTGWSTHRWRQMTVFLRYTDLGFPAGGRAAHQRRAARPDPIRPRFGLEMCTCFVSVASPILVNSRAGQVAPAGEMAPAGPVAPRRLGQSALTTAASYPHKNSAREEKVDK